MHMVKAPGAHGQDGSLRPMLVAAHASAMRDRKQCINCTTASVAPVSNYFFVSESNLQTCIKNGVDMVHTHA